LNKGAPQVRGPFLAEQCGEQQFFGLYYYIPSAIIITRLTLLGKYNTFEIDDTVI
jgi:hypothetical protein